MTRAPREEWWSRLTVEERRTFERARRQAEMYGTRVSDRGLALSLFGSKRMREDEER